MSESIIEKLKPIFSEVLSTETVPVEQRTKLNCVHWDSLNQLRLVLSIEQEFGTSLTDEEVLEMNSFAMAVEILKSKHL